MTWEGRRILTGQRRNELAGVIWDELDAAPPIWTIPAVRTKNARQHVVPLSRPMHAILQEAPRFVGAEGAAGYVFTTTGRAPISEFSRAKAKLDAIVLAALKGMCQIKFAAGSIPCSHLDIYHLPERLPDSSDEVAQHAPISHPCFNRNQRSPLAGAWCWHALGTVTRLTHATLLCR